MAQTTEINVFDVIAEEAMLMRVRLDKKTVTKYARAMEGGAVFPEIECFNVDGELILVDGFHRLSAYKINGVDKIHARVRIGTMDEAVLAAVRANAHEGLARSNADKEKAVKALLASGKWRGMSDREIAREAAVGHPLVAKLRKSVVSGGSASTSTSVKGKDGKNYPIKRTKFKPPSVPAKPSSVLNPPPLPKFTREQLGAPSVETENEQDPNSPPGVTRAMAHTQKYGHVHIRPLDERLRAEQEKKVTSFIASLRDLAKPAAEILKHEIEPEECFAAITQMRSGGPLAFKKLMERIEVLQPMLSKLNAFSATLKAKKSTAA